VDFFKSGYIYMSRIGSGSNSNGNYWYGNSTNFPGFLYKKNVGVGGRRSTKFNPGGNIFCNKSRYLYNKYKPGVGGVGATSTATRRAKNRLATICGPGNSCGQFYQYLGLYNKYLYNPNGYFNINLASEGYANHELLELKEDVPKILNSYFTNNTFPLNPSPFIAGAGYTLQSSGGIYYAQFFSNNSTSLTPWNFGLLTGTTQPCINIVQHNQPQWNTALPTPDNSNAIAFQGNSYIYQTLNGLIYNGLTYNISFYCWLRNTDPTRIASTNPANLYFTILINGVPVLNNFNPGVYNPTLFKFPIVWNQPTIANPTITFQQTNAQSPVNTYNTIYFTEPSISL
jgi:hypothetical protein